MKRLVPALRTEVLYAQYLCLVLGILSCIQVQTASANVNSPLFWETVDSYGGAWDGAFWYKATYRPNPDDGFSGGLDFLSGNWRSYLRIGANGAWVDGVSFSASSPAYGGYMTVPSSSSPQPSEQSNTVRNTSAYGLPAGSATLQYDMKAAPGTTNLGLRGNQYVDSVAWMVQQQYTITNTGSVPLHDVAFYQYYYASPYGLYGAGSPPRPPSHIDYTTGMADPLGYTYDITMYGEGTTGPKWGYVGMSTSVAPTAWDVGHGGGYPDPPHYTSWNTTYRPYANSTDILREVENDTLLGRTSFDAPGTVNPDPGDPATTVAGAFEWYVASLDPGASFTIPVLQYIADSDAVVNVGTPAGPGPGPGPGPVGPTTVPAPGAIVLVGLGVGLVGWLRRRKELV